MMGLVAHRIQKVQRFSNGLVIVGIVKYHLIRQSLYCKLEGKVGTHITGTNNSDFSCFN
jgi:hypothetical protein